MEPMKPWQIVTIVLAAMVAVAVVCAVISGIVVGIGLTASSGRVQKTMTQVGNDLP